MLIILRLLNLHLILQPLLRVKLIDLKENTKLISIAKVRKSDTILSEEVEELNEGSTTES